jgi:hypothetical protein
MYPFGVIRLLMEPGLGLTEKPTGQSDKEFFPSSAKPGAVFH